MRLATFQPQHGVHCETTTLRNMLHHAGAGISEAMLFGLGQGIDFQYWDAPDPGRGAPMLTGRIEPALLSRNACAALGVTLRESRSPDPESASAAATELLAAGHVVGVSVDIFHLDYFSSRSHFASHYIAVYGLDDSLAHVVDTDQQGGAQTLPAESLRRARASDEGFMPSPHLHLYVENPPERLTTDTDAVLREQIWNAVRLTAERMTEDRGPRFGIRAMRRGAPQSAGWGGTLRSPGETGPGGGASQLPQALPRVPAGGPAAVRRPRTRSVRRGLRRCAATVGPGHRPADGLPRRGRRATAAGIRRGPAARDRRRRTGRLRKAARGGRQTGG